MAVKEYWDTVYVTVNKVMNMNSAQAALIKKIQNRDRNVSRIQSGLNDASVTAGVVSLFLTGGAATIVGLASATAGVIGSYSTYNKHLVKVMNDGCHYLIKLTKQLNDISKKYDQFAVELPFIHFTDKKVRYVQGAGRVVRAHIRGGRWISYR